MPPTVNPLAKAEQNTQTTEGSLLTSFSMKAPSTGLLGRGRHRQHADRLQRRMREAADTPELHENAAVLLADDLVDQLPSLDLIHARCLVETTYNFYVQPCDAEFGKGDAAIKSQTLGLL
jgi:hypothetical protein